MAEQEASAGKAGVMVLSDRINSQAAALRRPFIATLVTVVMALVALPGAIPCLGARADSLGGRSPCSSRTARRTQVVRGPPVIPPWRRQPRLGQDAGASLAQP